MKKRPSEALFVRPGFVWRAAALLIALAAIGGFVVLNVALEPVGTAQAQEDPTPPPGTGEDGLPGGGEDELGGGGEGLDGGGPPPEVDCWTKLPQPGYPRSWESAIPVSTYGVSNAVNRNLLHVIPLIGWNGLGPDINFTLYHNSADATSGMPLTDGMGFNLGPGWRISYGAQVTFVSEPYQGGSYVLTAVVIYDDGTQIRFYSINGNWVAEEGVFSKFETIDDGYRVTHPDQTYLDFDDEGRLIRIGDAVRPDSGGGVLGDSRNIVLIERHPVVGRIVSISDALLQRDDNAEPPCLCCRPVRQAFFDYDENGRLIALRIPSGGEQGHAEYVAPRSWRFGYDGSNRLETITDPLGLEIRISAYDAAGRITGIVDQRNPNANPAEPSHTYAYTYSADNQGMLVQVTDPSPGALTQSFNTLCEGGALTIYTDRRSNAWKTFWNLDNLSYHRVNGPIASTEDPLLNAEHFVFTKKLLTWRQDERGHVWTYAYDKWGNLKKMTDPVGAQAQPPYFSAWQYDSIYNNLLVYVPAATSMIGLETHPWAVRYQYRTDYPKLLARTIESQVAVAEIAYYLDDPPNPADPDECNKRTLVKSITDPMGVITKMAYDQWGQPEFYYEGQNQEGPNGTNTAESHDESYTYDYGSRLATTNTGCIGGKQFYHLNNRPIGLGQLLEPETACIYFAAPPNPCDVVSYRGIPLQSGWPADSVVFGDSSGFLDTIKFDGAGNLKELAFAGEGSELDGVDRGPTTQYDERHRPVFRQMNTNEHPSGLVRTFAWLYDEVNGYVRRTDGDGVQTHTWTDDLGRVMYTYRQHGSNQTLKAWYDYWENGLLKTVRHGDFQLPTNYFYDNSDRLTRIEVSDFEGSLRTMEYTYTIDDLPETITEAVRGVQGTTVTTFVYDNRRRLIGEHRVGIKPYGLTYAYDLNGNRTLKEGSIDGGAPFKTTYHYDVSDAQTCKMNSSIGCTSQCGLPGCTATISTDWNANRLLYSQTSDTTNPLNPVLTSTTFYFYHGEGNPKFIVTHYENPGPGQVEWERVSFTYDRKGQVVTHLTVRVKEAGTGIERYVFARGFRYDGARQRYLVKEYDLNALDEGTIIVERETWSDYDGDTLYASYTYVDGPDPGNDPEIGDLVHYEPSLGESTDPRSNPQTRFYAHDHLGTVVGTYGSGTPSNPEHRVFTAYGEIVDTPAGQPRLGYAGAWGYQGDPGSRLLHVGHRYYDPSVGRFLQRDPIGIEDGTNVYAYASNSPYRGIDPQGTSLYVLTPGGVWVPIQYAPLPAPPPGTTFAAWAARMGVITGVGGIAIACAYEIRDHVNRRNRRIEVDGGIAPYQQPFNPSDPWGWVQPGSSWNYQKGGGGKGGGSSSGSPPKPSAPCSGGWCFVGSTAVLTDFGLFPISSLETGQTVVTADVSLSQRDTGVVTRTVVAYASEIVQIKLGGEEYLVTAEHPFWVINRGWTPAGMLEAGDILISALQLEIPITEIKALVLTEPVPVYSISVEGQHTFFVGSLQVLVHNKSC